MRKFLLKAFIVIFLCSIHLIARTQSIGDYQSAASGNWTNTSSWARWDGVAWITPAPVPTLADGVINILAAHNVTVNSSVTAVDQLTVNLSGTLTLELNSVLPLADGAGDDLIINGNLNWNGGILNSPGNAVATATGTIVFSTANNKIFNTPVTNNGTVTWQNGTIFYNLTTTFTNNGTMNITGNNTMQNAQGTFINNGILTKTSAGTTSFASGLSLSNNGTMNLNAGTTQADCNFTNTATINFNNGSLDNALTFNHNTGSVLSGTGTFTNNGTLNLNISQSFGPTLLFPNSGVINGAGNLTVNNNIIINGNLQGGGTLIVNGNTIWNSGQISRVFINGIANTFTLATAANKIFTVNFTNAGTVIWQNGTIFFNATATFTNNGTMSITGNNTMQNAQGTFINNGTISKSSTSATDFNSLTSFTNSATGTIRGVGTINMSPSLFFNNGVIAPGLSPGILTVNTQQPLSANSTLQIEMLNGSGAGTGHDQLIRNGNLALSGTLTVTETGTVPNGTYTIINLTAGAISGSFSTTNLPPAYTLQVNSTDVRVIKNSTLPVHLHSFHVSILNNIVLLQWITENEINNSHFELQRSSNGINYVTIGRVNASTSSNDRKEYSFIDAQPLKGNNYYRLKQVDIDARFEYTPVRRVVFDDKGLLLTIYPNPVNDMLIVDFSTAEKKIMVQVFDANGKLQLSRQMKNDLLLKIPVQVLAGGVYYLQVSDGIVTANAKFMKL